MGERVFVPFSFVPYAGRRRCYIVSDDNVARVRNRHFVSFLVTTAQVPAILATNGFVWAIGAALGVSVALIRMFVVRGLPQVVLGRTDFAD